MHGLVSLLPRPYYDKVDSLWDELEQRFGLRGIRVTPFPHFSWQIGIDYTVDKLEAAMREVASATHPLVVQTAGIGLFTGTQPVIFIPVVKTAPLVELHLLIWEHFQSVGVGLSPLYAPTTWVPHISLAYRDLTPDNLGPIMEWLAFQDFSWEMVIDNLAFIYEPEGAVGTLKFNFKFLQG